MALTMTKQNTLWTARPVRIALVQCAFEAEPASNLTRAIGWIRKAAAAKADIVCLPELFRSPYFCNQKECPRDYTEPVPGEVVPALQKVAAELGIAIVGGSIFERAEGQNFNTACVIDKKGSLAGLYRKSHIPHDPAFYERFYFAEGNTGFQVFDLGFAKVSVLICYDQWFPEAARSAALLGAEIIFYPTAIGTLESFGQPEGSWQDAWETVQRGHAIANNLVVAPVNRVGVEGESHFWGGSFICDAFGKIISKGGSGEELVVADVDLGHSRFVRDGWRFFESRRPEIYSEITAKIKV